MVDVKTGALGKHTPGKWQAVKMAQQIGCAEWCVQYGDDGEHIADVVYEEADAHLIAAAPELLEEYCALRGRVMAMSQALRQKGMERWVFDWLGDGILDHSAAIAKAEGR